MKNFGFWKWIIISLIATPIALVLALFSAGAGHGDYILAKILFPYTMWSTVLSGTITPVFLIIAVAQFPIYGMILAYSDKRRTLVAGVLASVHLFAVVLCFFLVSESFSG
jgi:hypothetical protein